MKCERLTKLIKNWYIQVKDEALAPARMADFMRTHLAGCPICLSDPTVEAEVKKIVDLILPPTKIPKAVPQEESADYAEDEDSSLQSGDNQEDEEEQPADELDDEDEEIDELEDDDDDI